MLENTLRDLVFYSVGILINMSLHSSVNSYLLDCNLITKLIDVLKDSNLEDMDLARVAAKALHNLQNVPAAKEYWTENAIAKLDEVTLSVGEELDSIMVSHFFVNDRLGYGNGRRNVADRWLARSDKRASQRYARSHKRLPY